MKFGADAAQVYRIRAAQMRERAASMKDLENRKLMLSTAEGYEYLADLIEKQTGMAPIH